MFAEFVSYVSLSLKLKNVYFPKQLHRLTLLMEQTVLFEVGSELS